MKEKTICHYCKQVRKKLVCSSSRKKQLLSGLKQELLEKDLPKKISMQQLIEQIGIPETVAEQLQESVSAKEQEKAQKQNRLRPLIIAAVLLVLAVIGLLCYLNYLGNHNITYKTDEIIEEQPPMEDSDFIWETN